MCFHSKQSKKAQELETRFKAKFVDNAYQPAVYNGFQHPETPVIMHDKQTSIQLVHWGLIPHWATDPKIADNTLNARIETVREKPAFKSVLSNRCLVLADGFFEWQWLDSAGKKKQKYLITLPGEEAFAFAGLWDVWKNPLTGKAEQTYTILTTQATGIMEEIHNSKKRMPLIIRKGEELNFLNGQPYSLANELLVAQKD